MIKFLLNEFPIEKKNKKHTNSWINAPLFSPSLLLLLLSSIFYYPLGIPVSNFEYHIPYFSLFHPISFFHLPLPVLIKWIQLKPNITSPHLTVSLYSSYIYCYKNHNHYQYNPMSHSFCILTSLFISYHYPDKKW